MDRSLHVTGGTAVIRLEGDVVVDTTPRLYRRLRSAARRRDVRSVVLDFSQAGRLDSSGVAAVSLGSRMFARAGKGFDLVHLGEHHEAAFELMPLEAAAPAEPGEEKGLFERVGEMLYAGARSAADAGRLVVDSGREGVAALVRRRRLPAGSVIEHASDMGVGAVPIVALLSLLLGMTLAFQASIQLEQFGADVFVADLVGMSVVREFGPLMTAIILTGRTGAAIAAELGTMRVREEVDALRVMGVSPVRFLVVPRLIALTAVQPALTLMAMFVSAFGGMIIAVTVMDVSAFAFWERIANRVQLGDFAHGLGKSVAFAWIIGLVGCYTGLRTRGGASSVGTAATRAVVTSIFFIIVVDSAFATLSRVGAIR
jgi:phospholipid/cholesterol/gamma-HCH transport system permease protein